MLCLGWYIGPRPKVQRNGHNKFSDDHHKLIMTITMIMTRLRLSRETETLMMTTIMMMTTMI